MGKFNLIKFKNSIIEKRRQLVPDGKGNLRPCPLRWIENETGIDGAVWKRLLDVNEESAFRIDTIITVCEWLRKPITEFIESEIKPIKSGEVDYGRFEKESLSRELELINCNHSHKKYSLEIAGIQKQLCDSCNHLFQLRARESFLFFAPQTELDAECSIA